MIDLSNGATGTIAGNLFVQGADKENYSAFIMVAPEGVEHSSAGLAVTGNEARLVPGLNRRTAFVADESGEALTIADNRLAPLIGRRTAVELARPRRCFNISRAECCHR